jgi:5-methyltetrahydrofolate--homocysteine methyltransferase
MRLAFWRARWEQIERDYSAWWRSSGSPLVQIQGRVYSADGRRPEVQEYASNYPWEMSAEEIVARETENLETMRFYGDAYPRWWVNFGPGIAAGFLGAAVHTAPHTVWFEPPNMAAGGPAPISEVTLAYQADNPWWRRVQAITRVAAEAWGREVQVSFTDLGGNLDIAASLRTTEGLLYDLYDAPEEVERVVGEVTRLWLRYYEEQLALIRPHCRGTTPWAPIWSAATTYMLQCDFSYMIAPAMFERFVMPDLAACCGYLEHAFYHLDGRGQIPHLNLLLSLPRLRGIQWIPGDGAPPPHEWLDLLRRIIAGGKLCQLYVSAAGARTIVRNWAARGFCWRCRTRWAPTRRRISCACWPGGRGRGGRADQ